MGRRHSLIRAALVCATTPLGADARAQARVAMEGVAVEFSDCEPERFSAETIVGAVRRELEGVSVLKPRRGADATERTRLELHLDVDCSSEAQRIHAAAVNPSSGARVERDLSLADVPVEDRPRVVALASGELVEILCHQLDARSVESAPTAAFPPTPDAPSAPQTAPPEKPRAPAPPLRPRFPSAANAPARDSGQTDDTRTAKSPRVDWLLTGNLRWFPEHGGLLVGGSAGVGLQRFVVGVEAFTGSSEDPLGEAWVGSSALTAGYELVRVSRGALVLRGALAGALGLTWAAGEGSAPGVDSFSTVQLYMDARANLVLAWGPSDRARWLFGVEIGRAAGLVATADHQPIAATGGWFAGTSLGGRF